MWAWTYFKHELAILLLFKDIANTEMSHCWSTYDEGLLVPKTSSANAKSEFKLASKLMKTNISQHIWKSTNNILVTL